MDEKEKKNHPPGGMREEKQSGHLKSAAGAGNREEMKVLRIGDRAYPELLRHIPDPPEILYAMGDTRLLRKKCVAVVGARKASSYGKWVSYNIGRRLAEYDIVTVSGMAFGCDSEAHRGALEAGGATIAVMGCGADICYPSNTEALWKNILRRGLILSEYPPGTKPRPYTFPQRNRIISGISEAVAVAEAGLSSGSLITAACAAEQGKTLFAVPGNISASNSIGCNKLIQDGAVPVAFIDDIITGVGLSLSPERKDESVRLGKDEREIYDILKNNGEITSDFIAERLNKSVLDVNAIVSVMEIKGFLSTSAGKIFIAK